MKKGIKILIGLVVFAIAFAALWIIGSMGPPATNTSDSGQTSTPAATETPVTATEFGIGETWTVDGQWTLTVDSIEETQERNETYTDHEPGAVYIVSYTYENLGYTDLLNPNVSLFFGMDDSIVDSAGVMGYSYPGDVSQYAQETPIGATCHAQACIGVDDPGTVTLNVLKYDTTETAQNATFVITP